MAILMLIGLLTGSVSVHAGDVVQLPPPQRPEVPVKLNSECQIYFLKSDPSVRRRPREQGIIDSLLELVRGRMDGREWEADDLQTEIYHSSIAPSMPRLGPSRSDSVIVYASRTGQFVAIQLVRPYQIYEIADVLEMMNRFSDPLVAADKIGIEIWFGKGTSKIEAIRYASSGRPTPINTTAEDFHRGLLAKGLLVADEDLGVHSRHTMSRGQGLPSVIWTSVRMQANPNDLTVTRITRIVDQIRESVGNHWSLDVGVVAPGEG